jgi:hypothetical protein
VYDRESLAWAAGLFEGEGSISGRLIGAPRMSLGMTDEDVVQCFHVVVGCGKLRHQDPHGLGNKDLTVWAVQRFEHVQALVAMFWPWLGERRRARAVECLTTAKERHNAHYKPTHCQRGHPFDEANTLYQQKGWRLCRTCDRVNKRLAWRRKHPDAVPRKSP